MKNMNQSFIVQSLPAADLLPNIYDNPTIEMISINYIN